jgi:uncharacterized NAD(P)/FAD-binding protein YdhS
VFQVPTRHAIIIGGGASGVLLAYQLLRNPSSGFRVTIIEQRPEIGRGVAYRSANPDHLLNVRAANMSALPDAPDHFLRWLSARTARGGVDRSDPFFFAPRGVYGEYLASLIEPFLHSGEVTDRLSIVRGQCITARELPAGVEVTLAHGPRLTGDVAILATGHEASTHKPDFYVDPWSPLSSTGIGKNDSILILGTGLTMVDYVLALLLDGHQGEIVAISRRGLLPRPHRDFEPVGYRHGRCTVRRFDFPIDALVSEPRRPAHAERRRLARGRRWVAPSCAAALARITARLQASLPRTCPSLVGCASSPHGT